ncbi:hypothetical protein ACFPYI_03780 [Halomarina salina]|uniref:Uncharacterized protein n=1 Tax=Halomarina salina TaxID=1872699 RepID=A0ABD5RJA8_9EURY|nr:hypothetical protein [Halomarina salina]
MTRPQSDRDDSADASSTAGASAPDNDVRTTACSTAPGRTLLVEEGNRDGWISSALVVDISDYR